MARTRLAGTNPKLQETSAAGVLNLLTAAKTPAVGVFKLTKGQRLGASSEQERQEGAAVRLAAQKEATELAAKKAQEQQAARTNQLQSLRSALGIDELIKEIQTRMQNTAYEQASGSYDFEMPTFEYPEFNYADEYETTEDYLDQVFEPETESQSQDAQSVVAQIPISAAQKATKTNTVKIAGTSYDLTKKGGSGFSTADISYLKNKGLSTSQIIKAASQSSKAPSAGAQKELGINVKSTSSGGFTVQKAPTKAKSSKPSAASVFFASPAAAKQSTSKAAASTVAKSSSSPSSKAIAAQFFPAPAAAAAPKAAAPSSGGGGGGGGGGSKGGGGGSSGGGGGGKGGGGGGKGGGKK